MQWNRSFRSGQPAVKKPANGGRVPKLCAQQKVITLFIEVAIFEAWPAPEKIPSAVHNNNGVLPKREVLHSTESKSLV
jgi:hypothetical protein